jgi:hypothetical protein
MWHSKPQDPDPELFGSGFVHTVYNLYGSANPGSGTSHRKMVNSVKSTVFERSTRVAKGVRYHLVHPYIGGVVKTQAMICTSTLPGNQALCKHRTSPPPPHPICLLQGQLSYHIGGYINTPTLYRSNMSQEPYM